MPGAVLPSDAPSPRSSAASSPSNYTAISVPAAADNALPRAEEACLLGESAHGEYARRAVPKVFSAKEFDVFVSRTILLVWLMLLQSVSSFVLEKYSKLVAAHPVLTYCLTFLVGTGGNASAQTATIIVRGIATGEITRSNQVAVLGREILIGLGMGLVLSFFGFIRVYFFFGNDFTAALSIAICLLFLCVTATCLATLLPLLLVRLRRDPAHAAPTVSVLMDIVGVTISCVVFTIAFAVLPSGSFGP